MLRTIVLLIITLLAIPYVAFHYDQPLAPEHWAVLSTLFKIMFGVAITCFVVSELTSNYSQVDKIWSIIPIVYVWAVAVESGFSQRLVLMAVMVTIWAVRLTFNFGRRGGYHWIPWKGEEDYRWSVLRQYPFLKSRVNWSLFNLLFISLYQNSLILLFTLPTVAAWQGGDTPLNILDCLAAALFLGFVTTETIADQQQWNFQTEKYRRKNTGEALGPLYEKGFCAEGLWAWVRHPNYASEQGIWLSFYLFSVAATGRWVNWSLAGAVLLMLLFLGSSDFSEKISSGKYPAYADYQKRVGRFFPKLF
jgi:steroid 5-alpha reductase family enzyme